MAKPDLSKAVLGGLNRSAPASSYSDIGNLMASSFQLGEAKPAAGASAVIAQQTVDEQKRAAAEAKARQAAVEEAKNAIHDPKRYEKVLKDDGGYDFYFTDPSGKRQQVDIATLAKNTNTRAVDWLKDSQNPVDIQYLNDYQNLNDFMNAVASKNKDKVDEFTQRAKAEGVDLSPFTTNTGGLDQLIKKFQQNYQRYYTPNWGAANGSPIIPTGSELNYVPGGSYTQGQQGLQ